MYRETRKTAEAKPLLESLFVFPFIDLYNTSIITNVCLSTDDTNVFHSHIKLTTLIYVVNKENDY